MTGARILSIRSIRMVVGRDSSVGFPLAVIPDTSDK